MTTTTWGRWTFNQSNTCLETQLPGGTTYQVPVDEMISSAAILDWIFQIHEKTWATNQDVRDLLEAILDLLGRGVCSGGVEGGVDPLARIAKVYGT